MTNKIFNAQTVETDDEYNQIDLADVVWTDGHAEIVDIDDEKGERWQEECKLADGRHYMLQWYFPPEVVPFDEEGNRSSDDSDLPWHKQEYIYRADRYDFAEEPEFDEDDE